jgi:hypothetical protein
LGDAGIAARAVRGDDLKDRFASERNRIGHGLLVNKL